MISELDPQGRPAKPMQDWQPDEFTKSSFSENNPQQCIEVAGRPGFVALRNSTDAWGESPIVECTPGEFEAFLKGVKAGEFDKYIA